MTIAANTAWGSAIGSGTTGPFAVPFVLYSQTHLQVLQVSNNVPTTMNLGTDYTFTSWNADNKGQVAAPEITFTTAVAGGVLIVFRLVLPGTQLTAISNFSAFYPQLHEQEFDLEDQYSLMLGEWIQKAVKAPDWESSGNGVNLTLPAISARASLVLGFDASGNVAMYAQGAGGAPPFLTGYAFASLPAVTSFMLAMCTDGPIAAYNTVLGTWVKLNYT